MLGNALFERRVRGEDKKERDTRIERAAGLLKYSCDEGYNHKSCHLLTKTPSTKSDKKAAREELLTRHEVACLRGSVKSCSQLANLLHAARNNPRRAHEALEHACALGITSSCSKLGLMLIDPKGLDIPEKEARAMSFELFSKGCVIEKDAASCSHLAMAYSEGKGVEANADEAFTLHKRACKMGHMPACCNPKGADCLAAKTRLDEMALEGFRAFQTQCSAGDTRACSLKYLFAARGFAGEIDSKELMNMALEACAKGDGLTCEKVGAKLLENTTLQDALVYFEKAC
ncbi:unnamed protein product, partial [Laminaria digitata]